MAEEDDTQPIPKCPACKGRGWIVLLVTRSKCPDCGGSGIKDERAEDDDDEDTGRFET